MHNANGLQRMMLMNNPIALVLAPTRELAIQIYNASKLMTLMGRLKMAVVYGGADRFGQIRQLNAGVDILVATPGRLLDFIRSGNVNIGMVKFFVLDEADRMLVRLIRIQENIAPFVAPEVYFCSGDEI